VSGVVVVGSANLDLVASAARVPGVGETLLGSGYGEFPGGKGLNQALAAAAGGRTVLAAAIGNDAAGSFIEAGLQAAGVRRVGPTAARPTGRAIVLLAEGDNRILVMPGANLELDPVGVELALTEADPEVVSAMFEVPIPAVIAAANWCQRNSRRFILNASPIVELDDEARTLLLAAADPLIVNRGEASALLNARGGEADELALALTALVRSVIVTDGEAGACLAVGDTFHHVPATPVVVADTTGAGDAFAGTLAAALAHGADMLDAVRRATAAAAMVVATTRTSRTH